MIETVVMLPVILLLFLGVWFLKQVVDTRMRAVEAARYATWESVWNARGPGGQFKSDGALLQDIVRMKMDRGLVSVSGAIARQSLSAYSSSKVGSAGFAEVPQFVGGFFQNPEKAATESSRKPGTNQVPGFDDPTTGDGGDSVGSVISDFLKGPGEFAFKLSDFIAAMTLWGTEADRSVVTAGVTYRVTGTSVFRFLGDIDISQRGSILAHPYNVLRGTDESEYNRVFGTNKIGDCVTGAGRGHIFDLWFFPGLPVPGVQEATGFAKCLLAEIGAVVGAVDSVPIIGGDLGFKTPDGTLKEYPEKNL